MHRTHARRRLVVALFLGVTIAAVELISRAGLSMLERRGVEYRPLVVDRLSAEHRGLLEVLLAGHPSLFQHDAELGWTPRPGFRSKLCTIVLDGRRRNSERPETDRVRGASGDLRRFLHLRRRPCRSLHLSTSASTVGRRARLHSDALEPHSPTNRWPSYLLEQLRGFGLVR